MIKEKLQLPNGPTGTLYELARDMVEQDGVREIESGRYKVQSQTHPKVWYRVYQSKKRWVCECKHNQEGHRVCKHVLAAFIITASEYREDLGGPDKTLIDLPKRWCRYCGSTDCRWRETRPLKRMEGGINRYGCLECGKRFTDRPGFEGLHFDDWVVTKALRQVARGLSPNEAARSLREDDDIEVSGRNVQRWVDEYHKMIEAFSRMPKIQGGDVVSVDEKHFKSNGKSMWFFNTMCSSTRFILSTDTADDKLNYNADGLFADMLKRLSRCPRMILSDHLRGFRVAFKNILATNPVPESIHINNLPRFVQEPESA